MTQRPFCSAFMAIVAVTLFAAQAQAALVGLWQFEGNVNDASGYGNHGALVNGASFSGDTPTGGGQSLFVNGGAQHALVGHDPSLNSLGQLTIAAWVRTEGNVAWDGVVAKSPSNGSSANHAGNYELRIENGTRVPTFLYQRGGFDDTAATNAAGNPIPNSDWTHLAVTVNGSNSTYYIDGNAVAAPAMTAGFGAINSNPLYIGNRADLFTVMNGRIDDLAVFDHVLSAADVQQVMAGNFASFATGPAHLEGVSIDAVSSEIRAPFNRQAEFIVNGAGSTASGFHTVTPDGFMWLNNGIGFGGGDDNAPFIRFDLEGAVNLDAIQLWNYNEILPGRADLLNRGVATMEILTGDDPNALESQGTFDIDIAPGSSMVDFSQLLDLDLGLDSVRYVQFNILSNHNGVQYPTSIGSPDNAFVGLSEVRFIGTRAIPEPSTALLGLLAVGLLGRRRRAAA